MTDRILCQDRPVIGGVGRQPAQGLAGGGAVVDPVGAGAVIAGVIAVPVGSGVRAGGPLQSQGQGLVASSIGGGGLVKSARQRPGCERPVGAVVGIGVAKVVVRVHLPVIGGVGGKVVQGPAGGGAAEEPAGTGVVVAGVIAGIVGSHTRAGRPAEGRVEQDATGRISRACFIESSRQGRSVNRDSPGRVQPRAIISIQHVYVSLEVAATQSAGGDNRDHEFPVIPLWHWPGPSRVSGSNRIVTGIKGGGRQALRTASGKLGSTTITEHLVGGVDRQGSIGWQSNINVCILPATSVPDPVDHHVHIIWLPYERFLYGWVGVIAHIYT